MAEDGAKGKPSKKRSRRIAGWMFPAGVAVAGIGSAAALLLRGCWHDWGWPIRVSQTDVKHSGDEQYSYQVCTKCGICRLYDEKVLRPFGPLGYDLHDLIARDRAAHIRWLQKQQSQHQQSDEKRTPERA